MKIAFVLSGFPRVPVGGFSVVYEYASRLAARGHDVALIHPRAWMSHGLPGRIRSAARAHARSALSPLPRDGRPAWTTLQRSVDSRIVASVSAATVPDGDAVVATAWETAPVVAQLPASKGTKFQLVQHYETWAGPKALVDSTWRLPLHKIVIARWLADVARELGVGDDVTYIPNGIDHDRFRVTVPPSERDGRRVGFLYHTWEWKGTADAVAAVERVRAAVPGLDVVAYGTARRPKLPGWVTYHHRPGGDSLVELYNSLAVFVHASWTEGWPLPPAEAMACGCALAATANPGVSDYASPGVTALMTAVRDVAGLARAVEELVLDEELRGRIAAAGTAEMRRYTWARAVEQLEAVFLSRGPDSGGEPLS